MFGPHLIIDGSHCDTRKLADRILVEQVMNEYPSAIGMTKIGGPYMFEYQAPDPAYSGVSGIVVIAESHIAIHTFPELDYFTLDIFSCKNFDHEVAIEYIKEAFDVKEMDRMLVQRGLSFHGPHHGKHGATSELINTARDEIGSMNRQTPVVDETPDLLHGVAGSFNGSRQLATSEREVALSGQLRSREKHHDRQESTRGNGAGRMLWPQYGVTPDYGTYGDAAADRPYALPEPDKPDEAGVLVGAVSRTAIEPVLVNPTASISGLLDKMSSAGGQARALGHALSTWERMVRDREMTIALVLPTPVIAQGLREVLVYAAQQRYVDTIILTADDLLADLYESLGYSQYVSMAPLDGPVPAPKEYEAALACFTEFARTLPLEACTNSRDLWHRLGTYLKTRAPRNGLLQAAAAADVALFTPDLGSSTIGKALLATRTSGPTLPVYEDVIALAHLLGRVPRLGIIRSEGGEMDTLIEQARDLAPSLDGSAPTLTGSISLGTPRALAQGDNHIAIASGADLVLPLAITGLAQRLPHPSPRPAS